MPEGKESNEGENNGITGPFCISVKWKEESAGHPENRILILN